jgi:hypothetical protein
VLTQQLQRQLQTQHSVHIGNKIKSNNNSITNINSIKANQKLAQLKKRNKTHKQYTKGDLYNIIIIILIIGIILISHLTLALNPMLMQTQRNGLTKQTQAHKQRQI